MLDLTAIPTFLADGGGLQQMLMMFLLIAVVWVFLVILPGRRERKAKEQMLANLKKGERVLVQAGIIGRVAQVKDDTVVLEFNGTKIPFLRNTVVRVIDESSKDG